MALVAHLFHRSFPSFRPSFNAAPFDLGTFDSIATYKGGRFGRAESFSIGFSTEEERPRVRIKATYGNQLGQSQLINLQVASRESRMVLKVDPNTLQGKLLVEGPNLRPGTVTLDLRKTATLEEESFLPYTLSRALYKHGDKKITRTFLHTVDRLLYSVYQFGEGMSPILALAPVRTRPRRTYDQITDEFKPEGDHIPALLARIWQDREASGRNRLARALSDFGMKSSLFKEIDVKRLGKKPSDPFQILVTVAGPAANLSDVGYGVSQALPVIVQSVLASPERRLLLQQPEVHLHPRAQAALGTFFSFLVSKEKKRLVIETHSDFLVDRIRMEIARKHISARDVQILFFEKKNIETVVHKIDLDRAGNIINAPKSYRRFFLDEETDLLSRTND